MTTMQKRSLLLLTALLLTQLSYAQLGNVLKKAKETVKETVEGGGLSQD